MIVAAGFSDECNHKIEELPVMTFTLGNESFHLKPEHYIAEEVDKDKAGNEVKFCTLLLGPMGGGDEEGSTPMFILGTPFMRSNYIRFSHPKGEEPQIWIHDSCPEDRNQLNAMDKKTQVALEQRSVEISPNGDAFSVDAKP